MLPSARDTPYKYIVTAATLKGGAAASVVHVICKENDETRRTGYAEQIVSEAISAFHMELTAIDIATDVGGIKTIQSMT